MNIIFPTLFNNFETALSKSVCFSFWPMQLIQIDIIRLQSLQTLIQSKFDTGWRKIIFVAHISKQRVWACNFGCQNHFVSFSRFFEPSSNDFLRRTIGFLPCWHRIHFCGIDKIDAFLESKIQLGMSFGFGILLSKSHRSETNFTNFYISIW